MNLAIEMKGNKKKYIKSKKKTEENVGLLLNRAGDQVMKDMDEVLKPFFALLYWQGLLSGLPGPLH